jgi:hypothetical protein
MATLSKLCHSIQGVRAEVEELLSAEWPEPVICAETADGVATLEALERFLPQVFSWIFRCLR